MPSFFSPNNHLCSGCFDRVGGGHMYTINLIKWYSAPRPSLEPSFFFWLHLTFLRSLCVDVQTSSSLPHTGHHLFTYLFPAKDGYPGSSNTHYHK